MVGDGGTPGQGGDRGSSGAEAGPGGLGRLTGRRPRPGVARRGGCPGVSGRFVPTHSIFPTSFGSFCKCLPRKWRLRKGSESGKGGRDEMAEGQAGAEGEAGLERRQIWRRGGRKKTRTKQQQLFSAAAGGNEE